MKTLFVSRQRSRQFAERIDEVESTIRQLINARDAQQRDELTANAIVWAWHQFSTGECNLDVAPFRGVSRCREQWPDRSGGFDAFRKLESAPDDVIDASYSDRQCEDCTRVAWRVEQMPLALRTFAIALNAVDGQVNRCAARMGVTRQTVWRKMAAIEKWIGDHS